MKNRGRELMTGKRLSRRSFMFQVGIVGASAAGLSLLAGCESDDDDEIPDVVPEADDEELDEPDDDEEFDEPDEPGESPEDQILVVAQPQDISHFDPHKDYTIIAEGIRRNLYDPLIFRSDDLDLEPGLAESWEIIDDQTYEFHIRSGVTFHDGSEFSADDVKFSLDRLIDPETEAPHRSLYLTIEAVEIIDDSVVRVSTSVPDPIIPRVLPGYGGYILSRNHYDEVGDGYGEEPLGTGPFQFVSWERDAQVRLEANPDYWRGAPELNELIFRTIPDQSTRVAELLTGGVHIARDVHPSQVAEINESDTAQVEPVPGLFCMAIRFMSSQEPVDDPRVRQALAHAIDMDGIIASLLDGYAERTPLFLSPNHFGFNPDLVPYEYDPDLALALLSEAGYADGISLDLNIASNQPTRQEVAEVVVAQWAEIGVEANLEVTEQATFVDVYYRGDLDHAFVVGWGGWTADADNTYWNLFSGEGQANFRSGTIFYQNPEADELIADAREEMDDGERERLYHEAGEILYDEVPAIPLYQQMDLWGVSQSVQGFQAPYDERIWLWPVSLSE